MTQHLALVNLVVRDYDEAITRFTQVLGFERGKDEHEGGHGTIEPTAERSHRGRPGHAVLL